MTRKLIASLSSPTGRHSAKVYSYGPGVDLLTQVFTDGERQHYADMQTSTWAEAISETIRSLELADSMAAELLKLSTKH